MANISQLLLQKKYIIFTTNTVNHCKIQPFDCKPFLNHVIVGVAIRLLFTSFQQLAFILILTPQISKFGVLARLLKLSVQFVCNICPTFALILGKKCREQLMTTGE